MSNIDKRAQKELYAKVEQQAHSLRGVLANIRR